MNTDAQEILTNVSDYSTRSLAERVVDAHDREAIDLLITLICREDISLTRRAEYRRWYHISSKEELLYDHFDNECVRQQAMIAYASKKTTSEKIEMTAILFYHGEKYTQSRINATEIARKYVFENTDPVHDTLELMTEYLIRGTTDDLGKRRLFRKLGTHPQTCVRKRSVNGNLLSHNRATFLKLLRDEQKKARSEAARSLYLEAKRTNSAFKKLLPFYLILAQGNPENRAVISKENQKDRTLQMEALCVLTEEKFSVPEMTELYDMVSALENGRGVLIKKVETITHYLKRVQRLALSRRRLLLFLVEASDELYEIRLQASKALDHHWLKFRHPSTGDTCHPDTLEIDLKNVSKRLQACNLTHLPAIAKDGNMVTGETPNSPEEQSVQMAIENLSSLSQLLVQENTPTN